jgi:hypothetical protein
VIYIWVRATVPWEDERRARSEVRPDLRQRLDLWNATFDITYQRFRQRVRQIAELNHSRVEGAIRAEWDQIPEGAPVLPVDDDDWFAPDAARRLEAELVSTARGYLWNSRWIEVPISAGHRLYLLRRRLLPRTRPKWICTTNNYAMLKEPEARDILGNHITASRWFEPRLRPGGGADVKRFAGELGIANRTLASMTSLRVHHPRHRFGRAELIRKFRRYKRLYPEVEAAERDWSSPYVRMMAELMDELTLKDGS